MSASISKFDKYGKSRRFLSSLRDAGMTLSLCFGEHGRRKPTKLGNCSSWPMTVALALTSPLELHRSFVVGSNVVPLKSSMTASPDRNSNVKQEC
jgi:hypothetical protein